MDCGQLQGFLLILANIAETGTARQECLEAGGDVINVFRLH